MGKALGIAGMELNRWLRERSNLFFVFVFPILLVLMIGLMFGSNSLRIGVVEPGDPLGSEVVEDLDRQGIEVIEVASIEAGVTSVEHGELEGLLVLDGSSQARFAARPEAAAEIGTLLSASLNRSSLEYRVTNLLTDRLGLEPTQARSTVQEAAQTSFTPATVESETIGTALFGEVETQFDLGASQELVLFVFLTSLASSGQLILSRKLGVIRRMVATPTSTTTILIGETLGRYLIALVQALFILGATRLLFGVNWGSVIGVVCLIAVFCLVGTGAGMLLGSVSSNEEQASGVGVMLSLGLAALGGAMVPTEIFSDTMRTAAKFTPHSWALQGLGELQFHGGGVTDILPELAALSGFAVLLLALATLSLRRNISA